MKLTAEQFGKLAKWIRWEAICAAAYNKCSIRYYAKLQKKRAIVQQDFWESVS